MVSPYILSNFVLRLIKLKELMLLRKIKLAIIITLLGLFSSCTHTSSNSTKEAPITSQDTSQVKIKKSTHYIYYIPGDSIVNGILIVLDPHGKPAIIMDSLHSIADNNHLALLGLNDIRNGISAYKEIINRDLHHFESYAAISPSYIYLLGFSGGSRMAAIYARRNRINGLILCGAGLNRQTQFPFPVVMISGMGDFNFMEQYYTPDDATTFNKNIITLNFKGKHQWPKAKLIADAIDFVIGRNEGKNSSEANAYAKQSTELLKQKEYYLSFKAMEMAYKLSDGNLAEKRKQQLIALSNNPNVKSYFHRLQKYINEEQQRYQMLSHAMEIQDLKWWNNQIDYIESKAADKKNKLRAASYQRTKAYLGILVYSRLSAASSGRGHYNLIPKYLEIYKRLEPKNPDLFFFKAIYALSQDKQEEALNYLRKAKKLGFNDQNKIYRFFPQELINKLKS